MILPIRFCTAAVFALATALLRAEDPPSADSDLPQPLNEAMAQDLLNSSPFTRSLNLSDSYHLTGMAYVGGRPVATFYNTATRESFVVSEEPNAQGWKLVGTSPSTDLKRMQVKLMIGAEVITVRYNTEQAAQPLGKKGPPVVGASEDEPRHKSHKGASLGEGQDPGGMPPALSDKFQEIMKARMEKHPEYTDEQKAAYAQKLMSKLQSGSQKAAAAASGDPSAQPAPRVKGSKAGKGM